MTQKMLVTMSTCIMQEQKMNLRRGQISNRYKLSLKQPVSYTPLLIIAHFAKAVFFMSIFYAGKFAFVQRLLCLILKDFFHCFFFNFADKKLVRHDNCGETLSCVGIDFVVCTKFEDVLLRSMFEQESQQVLQQQLLQVCYCLLLSMGVLSTIFFL